VNDERPEREQKIPLWLQRSSHPFCLGFLEQHPETPITTARLQFDYKLFTNHAIALTLPFARNTFGKSAEGAETKTGRRREQEIEAFVRRKLTAQ
jgi:hypothetical protein